MFFPKIPRPRPPIDYTPPPPQLLRELAALNVRLTTLGYQDGVDDGAEAAVQEGFDQGYATGAAAGWEAGLLYGGVAAAAAALTHVESLHRNRGEQVGPNTKPPPRSVPGQEGEGSSGSAAAAAVAVDGASPQSRHEVSDDKERPSQDEQSAAVVATSGSEGLGALVEELRRTSLLGPDGPRVDRADVIRRLRLLGPAGVAVAGGL